MRLLLFDLLWKVELSCRLTWIYNPQSNHSLSVILSRDSLIKTFRCHHRGLLSTTFTSLFQTLRAQAPPVANYCRYDSSYSDNTYCYCKITLLQSDIFVKFSRDSLENKFFRIPWISVRAVPIACRSIGLSRCSICIFDAYLRLCTWNTNHDNFIDTQSKVKFPASMVPGEKLNHQADESCTRTFPFIETQYQEMLSELRTPFSNHKRLNFISRQSTAYLNKTIIRYYVLSLLFCFRFRQ